MPWPKNENVATDNSNNSVFNADVGYSNRMPHHAYEITVSARGKGFYEVTFEVARWAAGLGVREGLLTVFVQHTSASLVI